MWSISNISLFLLFIDQFSILNAATPEEIWPSTHLHHHQQHHQHHLLQHSPHSRHHHHRAPHHKHQRRHHFKTMSPFPPFQQHQNIEINEHNNNNNNEIFPPPPQDQEIAPAAELANSFPFYHHQEASSRNSFHQEQELSSQPVDQDQQVVARQLNFYRFIDDDTQPEVISITQTPPQPQIETQTQTQPPSTTQQTTNTPSPPIPTPSPQQRPRADFFTQKSSQPVSDSREHSKQVESGHQNDVETYSSSSRSQQTNNIDLPIYSKIIQSSPNVMLLDDRLRYQPKEHFHQQQHHHIGHLSRIRTGHQEPLEYHANNGLKSLTVAVLIGLGVTGTLLAIVNHKMRTFKSRLLSKQQRNI